VSVAIGVPATKAKSRKGNLTGPWRKPYTLRLVTLGYLLWSLLPVVIAVIFSFNEGRSRIFWQGFSLRWWTQDPTDSLLHDPAMLSAMRQTYTLALLTVVISVPIGTLFAIGVDRWHGRPARTANFTMLLSFVVPEIILGVSLYILFTNLFAGIVPLGTPAQLLGLITFQMSYPVVIVRARLISIGSEYEEAAMDLGATPNQAVGRILLPLLAPAIMASVALVFADVVDDFVTVAALSSEASSETLAQKIYAASRSSPTPEVNAAATMMLMTTLLVVGVGLLIYRRISRGQTGGGAADFVQL
jgi:spermidine/putrescine transport system permease protein